MSEQTGDLELVSNGQRINCNDIFIVHNNNNSEVNVSVFFSVVYCVL